MVPPGARRPSPSASCVVVSLLASRRSRSEDLPVAQDQVEGHVGGELGCCGEVFLVGVAGRDDDFSGGRLMLLLPLL